MLSLISSFTKAQLAGAAVVLFIAYQIASKLYENVQIRRLGARAPIRRSYLPYSLDQAYEIISHAIADKHYELWVKMFTKWAPGRWTMEAGVAQRVILTADPENIKTILATQFKDFGKGEDFHRDFHDFIGNGA